MIYLKKKRFWLSLLLVFMLILINTSVNAASKKKASNPQEVKFQSKDGFNLTGYLYTPPNASLKHKVPVVLLLHSIGEDSSFWGAFPFKIMNTGKAVLAMDMRGHGKSIYNKYNKRRDWMHFSNQEFQKYPDDINSAIKYLKENNQEINTAKVGLIGANISGSTAIIATKSNLKSIKTIVVLSPVIRYKGIDPRIPLVNCGKTPLLIIASKKDTFSFHNSTELWKYAQGPKSIKIYPFGGNGSDLLRFQPTSQSLIINWLNKYLK